MIIDVSHLSDEGFQDVAKYTLKPFLASHSNSRVLCPHPRNLTDDMLRLLAKRGGIVGMNFYFNFLDNDLARLKERGTAEAVVDHIEHIKKVAGLDIITLGSDFDGIDQTLDSKDGSRMGVLVSAMEKRGFTASEIEKVFNLNAMRFFKEVL
jgi:membrane dipeptidase